MSEEKLPKPGFVWSTMMMKCPRCRRGPMFRTKSAYQKLTLKNIFDMYDRCPVCDQKYDMEPGFWYGTGYVSYALAIALCVASCIAWWVLIGFSITDNRIFWWLSANAVLLIVLQPWLMRLSRAIYIRIFVGYDPQYKDHRPKEYG